MAYSLYPAFVRVLYSTAYGIHTMTLPTNEWSPGDITSPSGYFASWAAGTPRAAEDMITDLLDVLAPFVSTLVNFGRYTIYTMEDPTAFQLPRYTAAIDVDGTATANALDESCQLTFHWKTTEFNDSKITLLDSTRLDTFNKILNPLDFTDVPALNTVWTDEGNAWRGRDGARPAAISTITCDINDRLRRARRDA
jgi:hypothetical protein